MESIWLRKESPRPALRDRRGEQSEGKKGPEGGEEGTKTRAGLQTQSMPLGRKGKASPRRRKDQGMAFGKGPGEKQ